MSGQEARWARWAWGLPMAAGAVFIVGFLAVSLSRVGHPFALEWMEGGSVDVVRRILDGRSIYVEPSLEYVPFIYTPAYFYAAALASAALGGGFLPLRLLSLGTTLATLAVIHALVRRETGDRVAAFLSAALFAATFGASGAWFDLGRVDPLFILFLALTLLALRRAATRRAMVAAGLLLALAFLTKQTAVVVAAPLVVFSLLFQRRLAAWFIGSSILAVGLVSLGLDQATAGWYSYSILLPGQDLWSWARAGRFFIDDLIAPLPIAAFGGAVFLWLLARRREWRDLAFWALMAAGAIASACLGRGRSGGYLNVLMPAHLALSILFGLAVHRFRACAEDPASRRRPAAVTWPGGVRPALGALACCVQFGLLVYDPMTLIPSARDRAAGWDLVRRLGRIDGDVLVPLHAYLVGMAGKRAFLQGNAGLDTLRSPGDPVRPRLIARITEAVRQQRFRLIILDRSALAQWNQFEPLFDGEIEKTYVRAGPVFERDDLFWPVTGSRTRPAEIWVPREPVPSRPAARNPPIPLTGGAGSG